MPLFEPIKTRSGTLITDVPLPQGTNLVLSFAAYNRYVENLSTRKDTRAQNQNKFRNKTVWGNDADIFRPERWLEEKGRTGPNVGGYSNLWVAYMRHASFHGG